MSNQNILNIENVSKTYVNRKTCQTTQALNNVSFNLKVNETVGIVGESGSGKSTLAKIIIGLVEKDRGIVEYYDEVGSKKDSNLELYPPIQHVFQNPISSLNPRLTIFDILNESMVVQTKKNKAERSEKISYMIERVGLKLSDLKKYPHEFSGGQAQRIAIARALIVDPRAVILDEAVSALDVTVQKQILNLLESLKEELGISYIFISHDLRVVREICDQIVVMYKGKIVERNSTREIFNNPQHEYTNILFNSIPEFLYL